jgi:hypothetical protein
MKLFTAVALVVASVVTGAAASVGATGIDLDNVAASLRQDPVYVDDDAERALSEEDAERVRDAIRSAGTPIYVAVLPQRAVDVAGGDSTELASQLADAVGRPGTYGVVVGDSFRAGSSELPGGRAAQLVDEALSSGGDDTAAVLSDFVRRVGHAAASSGSEADGSANDDDGTSSWFGAVLLIALVGGGGYLLWRRTARRKADAAARARAEAADRQMLAAELSVVADDVLRLDTEVQLHPEAQRDFDAAVNRYRAASAALEYAGKPVDLKRVGRVIEEARYLMDRVRALIDGREPPPPPDRLRRPGEHGEPAIDLDDDHHPRYVGYPGGFSGGWFGSPGSLFGGLLLGSMLFGGWGYGPTTIINEEGDGGDFGGGDFGGGDFGGGDFGGGDFGGGDF